MSDKLVIGKIFAIGQGHQSEAPRIGKPDDGAVTNMKDDMFVFGMIAGVVREIARCVRCRFLRHIVGSLDNHPPGHSKMREQDVPSSNSPTRYFARRPSFSRVRPWTLTKSPAPGF
jgi:hypothetical protein